MAELHDRTPLHTVLWSC